VAARLSPPTRPLLVAGLARDFQQMRLQFLSRMDASAPLGGVESWLESRRAAWHRSAR
jgi:glutamate dehydrogenase